MVIYKAYRFRMYPTQEQQEKLNQNLGSSRFVYNYYLEKKQQEYKRNTECLSLVEMKGDLNREA